MGSARSFTDLVVWQKAHALVKEIYKITGTLPAEEKFGLINQMRRAAVSNPCKHCTVRREEPACSGITMMRDAADPSRVLLYELWPDRDSYMGPHMETPHIKAFKAQAGELFTGAPEISFWDIMAKV